MIDPDQPVRADPSTVATAAPTDVDQPDPRRWLILAVVMVGQFIILASTGSVNIALGTIRADLGASAAQMQWVIVLYQLGYAAVLITGGRLGDLYGRRRMFLLGLTGFIAASALAAAAPTTAVLVLARLAMGIAGGVTSPQVLAMIQTTFPPRERPKAFAVFGTIQGSGFMLGLLLAGGLLNLDPYGLGWRSLFLMNVVFGLVALVLGTSVIPSQDRGKDEEVDIVGVVLATSAGLLLLYPLIQGRSAGWPPAFLVLMACAVPAFLLFLRWERSLSRRDGHPLVDFDLFGVRSFRSGLLIGVAQAMGSFSAFFFITITLQLGFQLDPLETALATAPIPIGFATGSMVSARLLPRFGRRMLAGAGVLGLAAAVAVFLSFAWADLPLNPLVLAPAFFLLGCNNGTSATSLVNLTLTDVPQHQAGSASGVMQMVQQSTSAVSVAMVGLLYFGAVGAGTSSDDYVSGLGWAMATMALSATAVFVLHFTLPPGRKELGEVEGPDDVIRTPEGEQAAAT